jgi:hypothetical protein
MITTGILLSFIGGAMIGTGLVNIWLHHDALDTSLLWVLVAAGAMISTMGYLFLRRLDD